MRLPMRLGKSSFRARVPGARFWFGAVSVGLVVAACSGDDSSATSNTTGNGGNGGNGGSAANGSGSSGASANAGASGEGSGNGAGAGGTLNVGGSGPDPNCGGEVREAKPNPAGVFLMVDRSGSMARTTSAGTEKWADITKALKSFWGDAASTGLVVGAQFFPILKPGTPQNCVDDAACGAAGPCSFNQTCAGFVGVGLGEPCTDDAGCGGKKCVKLGACITECDTDADCGGATCDNGLCPGAGSISCALDGTALCGPKGKCLPLQGVCSTRDSCSVDDYTAPAVDLAALPGNASALTTALAGIAPDGFTPMGPALRGALARAKIYGAAHPGESVSVVLATDGFPSECDGSQNFADILQIAEEGATGAVPVSTYVIGVLSAQELAEDGQQLIDLLAKSGGTNKAFLIDPTKSDVEKQFLLALNTIRGAVVSCDFPIPTPTMGSVDYGLLNVEYTASGAPGPTVLPRASGLADCGDDPGWTLDVQPDQGTPTKLTLCPASCAVVQADLNAKVETRLGCPVVVKNPK
jgi:hypothetical protein